MIPEKNDNPLIALSHERLDKIKDNKHFIVKDAVVVPVFLCKLFKEAIKTFIVIFATYIVLSIAVLDSESLNHLISTQVDTIIDYKNMIVQYSFALTIVYLCFFTYRYWSEYVGSKARYLGEIEDYNRLKVLHTLLIEQVLRQHNLIDKK